MSEKFEDIKIVGLDESASAPSGQGSLVRFVFTLSRPAPHEWAVYFKQLWLHRMYMMKRETSVLGTRLEIDCMPDELETHHLPELNAAIGETNSAYRKYLENKTRIRELQIKEEQRQREQIQVLKKRLKFD